MMIFILISQHFYYFHFSPSFFYYFSYCIFDIIISSLFCRHIIILLFFPLRDLRGSVRITLG
ncbi:hypothetical protein WDU94_013332 [Cyamophila willieti]